MFLLHKKRRRKSRKPFNAYYIICSLCLCIGIIVGYLNTDTDISYLLPNDTEPINLFKFTVIKHTVLLILIFLNGFSVLGFPLTAVSLVISGYFVTSSTSALFLNSNSSKLSFIMNNFPQTVLVISAIFLLSEAVLEFSGYLFSTIFRAGYKGGFSLQIKRLFLRFFISVIIILLASAYEAFVL